VQADAPEAQPAVPPGGEQIEESGRVGDHLVEFDACVALLAGELDEFCDLAA
jgi:hypothetical protein